MLSEKIDLLKRRTCLFSETVQKMPKNDQEAVIDALVTRSVSLRALEKLLVEEGFQISRDSLNRARMCATNEKLCKCEFLVKEKK